MGKVVRATCGLFGLLASLLLTAPLCAQTASILPNAKTQFLDAQGAPVVGGFVYTCVPNTSNTCIPGSFTPKTTWRDSAQSTPNSNPIVLDSAGSAFIFGSGNYAETLYDQFNNLIWTGFTSATLGAGIDQNNVVTLLASASVNNAECGSTLQLGTGSTGQFTLTLPSVSGFPTNCSIIVKDSDSTNGKILSGFPADIGVLMYPRQSFGIKIVNGTWQSFFAPAPWAPISPVTLFVSTTGNDVNDGLTVATPITLTTACSRRQAFFLTAASVLTIQLADGTYSTAVNGSLCSIEGNSGGGAQTLTLINGNCTTHANTLLSIPDNDTGIFVKDLGETEISCIKFQGAGSGVAIGISAAQFSVVDLVATDWGTFGSGSIFLNVSQSSSLNLVGTASMTLLAAPGGAGTVISLSSGANWLANSATTITIPNALAWGGQFLQQYGPTMANVAGMTFTGSGVVSTTGKQASLIGNSFLATGTIACATFFPGNGGCTLVQGAQDDANEAATSASFLPTFAISTLPACNSGNEGLWAYVTNGATSPTYNATVSATGAVVVPVFCNGANWTYH